MVTKKHRAADRAPRTPAATEPAVPRGMNPEQGVLADLLGLGPAPTRSRELAALVVNALLLGVVLAVVIPQLGDLPIALPATIGIGILVLLFGRRWLIGRRYWNEDVR